MAAVNLRTKYAKETLIHCFPVSQKAIRYRTFNYLLGFLWKYKKRDTAHWVDSEQWSVTARGFGPCSLIVRPGRIMICNHLRWGGRRLRGTCGAASHVGFVGTPHLYPHGRRPVRGDTAPRAPGVPIFAFKFELNWRLTY
jgi:hypothetical protein